MQSKIVLTMMLVFLTGAASAGLSLGSIMTQQQLNAQTDQQIKQQLNPTNCWFTSNEETVTLSCSSLGLERKGNEYIVIERSLKAQFTKKSMNQCIQQKSKGYCFPLFWSETIVPQIKTQTNNEFNQIKSWQTETDEFTVDELNTLIDLGDLSD